MKSYTESNEHGTSARCQKSKEPLDRLCVRENDRKSQQIGREMSLKGTQRREGKEMKEEGKGERMRDRRGGTESLGCC